MIPIYRSGSIIYRLLTVLAFCVTLLLPQQAEARVLAGSVTERKINRKIDSMLKAARKNYDNGKVQVALESYWKILEIDPQETFAYLELGEIYVGLRIYDRAIELLEPGLTMAQREMDRDTICYYYCILTQAHLALNQTGLANKTLIKAAEAAPKNPMPREILGDIYLANNRTADAIKAYKKAVELDPDYQSAKEKLGAVIAKHGDQPQTRTKDRNAIARKAEPLPLQKPATKKPATTGPAIASTAQKVAMIPATQTPPRPQPVSVDSEENADTEESEDEVEEVEEDSEEEPENLSEEESDDEVVEASSEDEDGEENTENAVIPDDMAPLPLPTSTQSAQSQPAARPMPTTQSSSTQAAAVPASTAPAAAVATSTEKGAESEKTSSTAPSASTEEIENQIDKLLAGTPEDKRAAVSFFVKLEDKGLTEIEELLYDPDPEVRIIAIRTATEFKAFKQRVKTMLEDATDDPDPAVDEEIEKALAQL